MDDYAAKQRWWNRGKIEMGRLQFDSNKYQVYAMFDVA